MTDRRSNTSDADRAPVAFEPAGGCTHEARIEGCVQQQLQLVCSVRNSASAGRGVKVIVQGNGLELVDVEEIAAGSLLDPSASATGMPERTGGESGPRCTALFPDLVIPRSPELMPRAPDGTERLLSSFISIRVTVRCTEPGSGQLVVRVVPLQNEASRNDFPFDIAIMKPRWRPLKHDDVAATDHPLNAHALAALRELDEERTLFALVALAVDRCAAADLAVEAFEQWHHVIGRFGADRYDMSVEEATPSLPLPGLNTPGTDLFVQLQAGQLDTSLLAQQLAKLAGNVSTQRRAFAKSAVGGAHWKSLCTSLPEWSSWTMEVASLTSEIDPMARQRGAGSAVEFAPGPDQGCPHVAMWLGTEGLESSIVADAEQRLTAIVDELAVHGHQAFVGRWDWVPTPAWLGTPYERASGVSGPCVATSSWCSRYLRGVTRRMWFGEVLAKRIDLDSLSRLGEVTAMGGARRLLVEQGVALDDLERALEPVLAGDNEWQAFESRCSQAG